MFEIKYISVYIFLLSNRGIYFIPFNGKNIQIMYFNCALSHWKMNFCECFYLNKLLIHHGLVGVQLINSKSSKATPTKSQDCCDFIYIETVLFGKTQLLENTLPQCITFFNSIIVHWIRKSLLNTISDHISIYYFIYSLQKIRRLLFNFSKNTQYSRVKSEVFINATLNKIFRWT